MPSPFLPHTYQVTKNVNKNFEWRLTEAVVTWQASEECLQAVAWVALLVLEDRGAIYMHGIICRSYICIKYQTVSLVDYSIFSASCFPSL